jgi:hypothetical protein
MTLFRRFAVGSRMVRAGQPYEEGEAGSTVTVLSLPGRRAAGGRPQGRP